MTVRTGSTCKFDLLTSAHKVTISDEVGSTTNVTEINLAIRIRLKPHSK